MIDNQGKNTGLGELVVNGTSLVNDLFCKLTEAERYLALFRLEGNVGCWDVQKGTFEDAASLSKNSLTDAESILKNIVESKIEMPKELCDVFWAKYLNIYTHFL